MSKFMSRKNRKGFTLVELAVVIVIIGVLASFGVPKFMQSVERSKASESFNFLSAVRSAQERYQAKEGTYTTDWTLLDIAWKNDGTKPILQYFEITTFTAATDSWSLKMTRSGTAGSYGAYTVVYNQDGFVPASGTDGSTIPDLINPLGNQAASGGGSGS